MKNCSNESKTRLTWFKSLKFSFTNKNHGAWRVNAKTPDVPMRLKLFFEFTPETKILRVTDDGCGIDSIDTLLTVAESGWGRRCGLQRSILFGIGFLSALFCLPSPDCCQ
jgi:hypothetical protein